MSNLLRESEWSLLYFSKQPLPAALQLTSVGWLPLFFFLNVIFQLGDCFPGCGLDVAGPGTVAE